MEKKVNAVLTLSDNYDESYDSNIYCIEIGAEENPDSVYYDFAKESTSPIIMYINIITRSCAININRLYFEKNKTECNQIINRILRNTQQDSIGLFPNSYLNEEVITIINENDNIEKIGYLFGEIKKEDFSPETFKLLNEPSETINVRLFVDKSYNYDSPIELRQIYSDKDLEKLKKLFELFPQREVLISGDALLMVEDLLSVIISEKVVINDPSMYIAANKYAHARTELEKNKTKLSDGVIVKYMEFENSMEAILNKYKNIIEEYNNVYFNYTLSEIISSPCLRNKDKVLSSIVEEMKNLNLTPLEAYKFIFDITKFFKSYKANDAGNYYESRHTHYILFNEYIVCAGYCDLAYEIIKKYNDPNLNAVIYRCLGGAHVRLMVDVNDDEYNVKGLYASEITWGNPNIAQDIFKYFLLTKDEVDALDPNHIIDCTDIIMCGKEGNKEEIYIPSLPCTDVWNAWDEAYFAVWKLYTSTKAKINFSEFTDAPLIESSKISKDTLVDVEANLCLKLVDKKDNILLLDFTRWLYYYLWGARKVKKNYISSHIDRIDIDESASKYKK